VARVALDEHSPEKPGGEAVGLASLVRSSIFKHRCLIADVQWLAMWCLMRPALRGGRRGELFLVADGVSSGTTTTWKRPKADYKGMIHEFSNEFSQHPYQGLRRELWILTIGKDFWSLDQCTITPHTELIRATASKGVSY
jgi:hypothetical protein